MFLTAAAHHDRIGNHLKAESFLFYAELSEICDEKEACKLIEDDDG